MDKQEIINALKDVKENGKDRKFNQTVDLIVNLTHLNLKKGK